MPTTAVRSRSPAAVAVARRLSPLSQTLVSETMGHPEQANKTRRFGLDAPPLLLVVKIPQKSAIFGISGLLLFCFSPCGQKHAVGGVTPGMPRPWHRARTLSFGQPPCRMGMAAPQAKSRCFYRRPRSTQERQGGRRLPKMAQAARCREIGPKYPGKPAAFRASNIRSTMPKARSTSYVRRPNRKTPLGKPMHQGCLFVGCP